MTMAFFSVLPRLSPSEPSMRHQQAILQGFQQLNAQLVQEELQKPPVAPGQGPQQNPQQQLSRLGESDR